MHAEHYRLVNHFFPLKFWMRFFFAVVVFEEKNISMFNNIYYWILRVLKVLSSALYTGRRFLWPQIHFFWQKKERNTVSHAETYSILNHFSKVANNELWIIIKPRKIVWLQVIIKKSRLKNITVVDKCQK